MVQVPPGVRNAMHDGLQASVLAMGSLASACRGIHQMQASAPFRDQLELAIDRLEAMRGDLERRLEAAGQDALFIALQVAEASLLSVAISIAEMRQAYGVLQPYPLPQEGWFTEDVLGPQHEVEG